MALYKLPSSISQLLQSGDYSDIILKCGDHKLKLHISIVCTQSEFLAKACKGPFKESETGIINLHDEDPLIVTRAIWYFYHHDYNEAQAPEIVGETEKLSPLETQLVNTAVFALADRWFAPGLQNLATAKFKRLCVRVDLWLQGIPRVLRAVYTSTPSGNRHLRDHIVRLCVPRFNDDKVDKAAYNYVFEDLPDAHIDVLKETLSSKQVAISDLHTAVGQIHEKIEEVRTENRKLKLDLATSKIATPLKWEEMFAKLNVALKDGCARCKHDYDLVEIHGDGCNFATGMVSVKCVNCGRVIPKY